MWLSALKLLAFASVVLLLGQVRVGSAKIGEHYYNATSHLWNKAGDEIKKSPVYEKLAEVSALRGWWNNVYPPPPPKAPEVLAPEKDDENDGDNDRPATDRESILKLLD